MNKSLNNYLFLILLVFPFLNSCNTGPVDTISKSIHTVDDIETIDSNLVKPNDYTSVVSLKNLDVKEKKQKFISMILPAILVAKINLLDIQNNVKELIKQDTSKLSNKNKIYLSNLLKKYKAKSFDQLLLRLNTHPNSIVLAQSAIESGWGTSRFFLEANNIFGIWSFNKNDDRIQAKSHRNGKATYLKKYSNLSTSIQDYFVTIGRGPYNDFRIQRTKTNNPYKLVTYLLSYSELGEEYVKQLQLVIKKNNLTKYDNYQIDPKYLNKENLIIKKIDEVFEFEFEEKIEVEQNNDSIKHDIKNSEKQDKNPTVKIEKPIKEAPKTSTKEFESDIPDFGMIKDVNEKKRQFFSYMRPKIIAENEKVLFERDFVLKMQIKLNENKEFNADETKELKKLMVDYRIDNRDVSKSKTFKELLIHIDIIPLELALTQAALESAWGTSYFARKANNIFGQWCFTPGCGVVPKRRPAGETHEVAIFDNVNLSVRYYLKFLNSHPLFSKLRKARLKNRKKDEYPNAYDMSGGLSAYSARGNDYIAELRSMIKTNQKYMGL
ncbi:MAG: hypothetical protein DRJ10_05935 [Bacteroidetes bacterium]|nr:MAG: hypothetical protein DRJ10_05935 [Bacteroidota bacterium]